MTDYHKAIEKWKTELAEEAWIGVDLDATFAEHGAWIGPLHIGKPIEKMVERVKKWLAEGKKVKVFTARVSEKNPALRATIVEAVQEWTEACVGERLECTCEKDYACVEIWDDRAIGVVPNTGLRADGKKD